MQMELAWLGGGVLDSAGGAGSATSTTEDLVRRACRGDADAFATLIRRFERTALAVAFGCCGDGHLSGDLTQEAFLRAWQRLRELKDEQKFAAWLCGIVRNLAADARRRGGGKRTTGGDALAAAGENVADPAANLDAIERRDQIAWALRRLDETSRAAVVLRYYEGLSSPAIAELTDSTPAAVDMRLSRARKTLRELLSDAQQRHGHFSDHVPELVNDRDDDSTRT